MKEELEVGNVNIEKLKKECENDKIKVEKEINDL